MWIWRHETDARHYAKKRNPTIQVLANMSDSASQEDIISGAVHLDKRSRRATFARFFILKRTPKVPHNANCDCETTSATKHQMQPRPKYYLYTFTSIHTFTRVQIYKRCSGIGVQGNICQFCILQSTCR